MAETQNYRNHVRKPPLGFVLGALVLLVNILWSGYRLVGDVSTSSVITFLVSVALLAVAVVSRQQTLTVQNRVIRLEQRLRFQQLLPADNASRASALPIGQIVALRFASDTELPVLVNQVLASQLSDPKAIKQKVKDWQSDFLRA